MKTIINFISLIYLTIALNSLTSNAQCHIDDWYALKQLYFSTNGDNWSDNTGWQEVTNNTPSANCNLDMLYGIWLDDLGRVENLILFNNQLEGNIPAKLGNLNNLTNLNLGKNQISGSIPTEMDNLRNLRYLDLGKNQISDRVLAELGSLSKLRYLFLDDNQFSSTIPSDLGNLSNLIFLDLSNNQISGNIPDKFCDLTNLTLLEINNNNLSGCFPDCISVFCSQLSNLNFNGNPDISDLSFNLGKLLYYRSGCLPTCLVR